MIGKVKDEVREKITNEFVGLKSKMYYLNLMCVEEIKKSKRVN